MNQFTFALPLPIDYSAESYYLSGNNHAAHAWMTRWPDWPMHALFLYGPAGSGKTHLAHIWAQRTGADILDVQNFTPSDVRTHCLLEDIEHAPSQADLLHLFNICKERGVSLLITSNLEPAKLPFTLPDLNSRLRSIPVAAISPPDDALLSGVMRKQFSDRQLMVDDEVIGYLIPRIERTLAGVKTAVHTLDSAALAEKKTITIPFVKRVLGC